MFWLKGNVLKQKKNIVLKQKKCINSFNDLETKKKCINSFNDHLQENVSFAKFLCPSFVDFRLHHKLVFF